MNMTIFSSLFQMSEDASEMASATGLNVQTKANLLSPSPAFLFLSGTGIPITLE